MSTLIVYASKYGCTEKCVDMIKKEINGEVEIRNLGNTKDFDFSKYEQIIIGGSVYMGMIRKEVKDFCTKNLEKLKEKRIGIFMCGMREGDAMITQLNQNFDKELINHAVSKEFFGGEFKFEKMKFIEKIIVKKVCKVTSNQSKILESNIHKFVNEMNVVS